MTGELLDRKISAAILHEQNTQQCFNTLTHIQAVQGRSPDTVTVAKYVNLVQNYVESVPGILNKCKAIARETGLAEKYSPLFDIAEKLFLAPPTGIPDNLGLLGILDNAYLTLGFLINVYGQHSFDVEFIELHLKMRHLFNEPLLVELDKYVASIIQSPAVQAAIHEINVAAALKPETTASAVNTEIMIQKLISQGKIDAELIGELEKIMNDPLKMDKVIKQLKALGADEAGGNAILNIADFYRDAPGCYELKWALKTSIGKIDFTKLDRKTQFFVLFQDWQHCEMEGMLALNKGDNDQAESIFQECLQRAEQIDVRELQARSYEGLMKVAQKRGDRLSEKLWLKQACLTRNE
jgi:hypothetical protein